MKSPSRVWALAASLLLAGSLAACGSDGDAESTTAPETAPEDTTAEDATTEATEGTDDAGDGAMADAATVMTSESDLGTILVDGEGMTLYLFTNDTPGVSNCEDSCLQAWPPLLGEPQAGDGVDEALLGTLTRSDGTTQASYNGWPLYYWAQDAAAGDTTGQGVNGVWWVVSPEGEAIGAA